MKRLILLLFLLLPVLALAEDPVLEVMPGETKGYGNNSITVNAPMEGDLLLRIHDQYNVYRTLREKVAAGENTITWDGLGENQERISDGAYTLHAQLTGADGQTMTAESKLEFLRCHQAMTFALPSSNVIYQGDNSWFAEIDLVRPGSYVMDVYDSAGNLVQTKRYEATGYDVFKLKWNASGLEAGQYVLKLYAQSNPDYCHDVPVTVRAGSEPQLPLTKTVKFMPEPGDTDQMIWRLMMQPSAVVDLRATSHQNVYDEPAKTGRVLGTLHGQSQAVNVLDIRGDGWVKISAWNHEEGTPVEGYVPENRLMMVRPNQEYGLLLDKQAQTLTVFHRGERLTTLNISTGLVAQNKLIRETPAGSYLTLEHMSEFASEGYHYDYPIRYDGGNLLHQLGHKERSGRNDFSDQTPQLGQKASHGCIRLPSQVNEDGINAYWLYTHLPYHTRLIILDDPDQRMKEAALANAGLKEENHDLPRPEALPELQEGETEIVVTLGGDTVLGTRESWWGMEEALPGYLQREGLAYPFAGLAEIFAQDDMTLVNLECVLKDNAAGEDKTKQWRFRGLPEYAQALTLSSIEQVNIANNHYIDYGAQGEMATRQALQEAGVAFSGHGFTYVWDYAGHRIGFGGCRETTYKSDRDVIARDIAAMKAVGCEVILYSCHWGKEYSATHNDLQEQMARVAIEAGANVVIGTHPHVVQGIDAMDGAVVLYSLGNMMFGGTHDMTTFDGTLARLYLRFDENGYLGCGVELIPILTSGQPAKNDFRPVVAQGVDRERILTKIQVDSGVQLAEKMWFPAR